RSSSVSSPSRNWYSSRKVSLQSDIVRSCSGVGASGAGDRVGRGRSLGQRIGEPVRGGVVEQRLLQRLSSPVQPAHHGADGDVEDLGDLLVGEALDVGQQDGHAEVLREVL